MTSIIEFLATTPLPSLYKFGPQQSQIQTQLRPILMVRADVLSVNMVQTDGPRKMSIMDMIIIM
jgi:hypothetical protein